MNEIKSVKCELCGVRYVNQQDWKKEFEKTHCATCRSFLKTLSSYEKSFQILLESSKIQGRRVRIYLEKDDNLSHMADVFFGKKQTLD